MSYYSYIIFMILCLISCFICLLHCIPYIFAAVSLINFFKLYSIFIEEIKNVSQTNLNVNVFRFSQKITNEKISECAQKLFLMFMTGSKLVYIFYLWIIKCFRFNHIALEEFSFLYLFRNLWWYKVGFSVFMLQISCWKL